MALAQRRSVASAHTFPPQSSSSRSKQQRPALPAKAVQRLRTPTTCIHKEYARQGSPTQEAEVSAAGSAVMHSRSGAGGLLSVPGDIVLECLTVLRRGELSGLQPYLPADRLAPQGAPVMLAGVPVHEQGPLARCAPFMDTAARRVLPGHLLRRARVLSSLQVGGSCLLRVALTACTGEENVLAWKLALTALPGIQQQQQQQQEQHLEQEQWQDHQQQEQRQQQAQQLQHTQQQQRGGSSEPDSSSGGDNGLRRACWQVVSIAQEAFSEEDDDQQRQQNQLLSSPHPRVPPELVVRAQLQALRQQQLLRACGFNLMGRHVSSSGWEAHLTAFKQLLQQPHYCLLQQHVQAELGSSALPMQRQFVQEVVLTGPGLNSNTSSSSSSSGGGRDQGAGSRASGGEQVVKGRFLWRLGMQADGCWMVRSIEVLE